MSERDKPKDLNEMREWASFFIAENDLDDTGRVDGGLYVYLDGSIHARDRGNGTHRVFTFSEFLALELFLAMVAEMKEQKITNVALFDEKEYEARMRRYNLNGKQ